jgi:hypothetical protein
MTVRALMYCTTITKDSSGGEKVELYTQYDKDIPEEARFAEASPSGSFSVYVKNTAVHGFFVPGKKYYFDVTLKEDPPVE